MSSFIQYAWRRARSLATRQPPLTSTLPKALSDAAFAAVMAALKVQVQASGFETEIHPSRFNEIIHGSNQLLGRESPYNIAGFMYERALDDHTTVAITVTHRPEARGIENIFFRVVEITQPGHEIVNAHATWLSHILNGQMSAWPIVGKLNAFDAKAILDVINMDKPVSAKPKRNKPVAKPTSGQALATRSS